MQDDADLPSGGRMECGVCWYVYDPAVGDEVWQVDPGTTFAGLPDHWRCPQCDTEKSKFLALDGAGADMRTGGDGDVAELVAAYRRVDQERMQDLPFRNDRLAVEVIDFQAWQGGLLGVVITPWFMNLTYLAGPETDWSAHRHGDLVLHALPSGRYEFVHGDLEGFGVLQSCSLISPVTDFEDMDAARETAHEVMRLMLVAPEGEPEPQGTPLKSEPDPEPTRASGEITRRELFRGRRAANPPQS
ncbi:MAG: [NiFe]-hydrogenase assembly chaperone HybE [Arenibacter algicola]|nr:[NiFe]-hydrogenase assembly chaperone HybE [Arenibacter algicola]